MDVLELTETFPHRAKDLMDLVMDAEKYTDISSYIKRIDVIDKSGNIRSVDATIETPVLPVAIHYGCDLERDESNSAIRAVATKSPFKDMRGVLRFTELANGHTRVHCRIEYRTGWNPVAAIAARVMESQIKKGVAYAREYLAQRLAIVPDNGGGTAPPPYNP